MEEDFENASSGIKELTDAIRELIAEKKKELDLTKEKNDETEDGINADKLLVNSAKKLASEFIKLTDAGIRFASTIGTQATQGVRLELQNRLAAVKQIISLDVNRAATISQIQAAEQSLADTFVGVREGFQLSAEGAAQFASNLKGGFRSEFQLTNESLRALVTTGMSTEAQFENFRKASGRASLSSAQFANIVNKNSLSFLLYGPKFAKAASEAERLGISLSGVQAAQQGLVTNLDGTIDTVAQLNQLGAQLDFGTLIRVAETEGPDALLAFVRKSVPENLMQSASTRALFSQLGISVEDYLKSGNKQVSAAESIEKQMTDAAKATSKLTDVSATLNRLYNTGASTFFGLISAAYGATIALSAMAAKAALGSVPKALIGLSALATGGASLAVLGGIAAAVGTGIALSNDMYSAGYGSRTLVTPKGAFALNNADDIIAGTNLFPKGALQMGSDSSALVRKVDELINTLNNASTVINVDGMTQTVPRLRLAGVYSRNEVR